MTRVIIKTAVEALQKNERRTEMEENKMLENAELQATLNAQEATPQGKPDGAPMQESAEMLEELRALKKRELEWVFKEDLAKIKKAFPAAKVLSIPDLGDDFLKMRSIGIDAVTAFAAIGQAKDAGKPTPPPSMGPVNAEKPGEREFFSVQEVRRMSQEQVAENLKKIEKSQKSW